MFEYSPQDIIVTWGTDILDGFADGTFVSGDRDEDGVMKHAGSKGDITATMNANLAGSVSCQFVQQCDTMKSLIRAIFAQEMKRKIDKRVLTITDLSGIILITAPNAWIKKPAKVDFAKEQTNREIVFDCDKLLYLPGIPLRA